LQPEILSYDFLKGRVKASVGDITQVRLDAIVNAANSSLLGGGGVDGAIHRAGGPEILAECRELRRTRFVDGLPTGEAVITTAGNLPARKVIHTVGPIYGHHHGREAALLASCYTSSLSLSLEHSLATIAFPAISTGIYGYPRSEAAVVASRAIEEILTGDDFLREVCLVFFTPSDLDKFVQHQQFSG
jgi:O-acetyl-ADP-ribose deacetylase (regulator of RNase III)